MAEKGKRGKRASKQKSPKPKIVESKDTAGYQVEGKSASSRKKVKVLGATFKKGKPEGENHRVSGKQTSGHRSRSLAGRSFAGSCPLVRAIT